MGAATQLSTYLHTWVKILGQQHIPLPPLRTVKAQFHIQHCFRPPCACLCMNRPHSHSVVFFCTIRIHVLRSSSSLLTLCVFSKHGQGFFHSDAILLRQTRRAFNVRACKGSCSSCNCCHELLACVSLGDLVSPLVLLSTFRRAQTCLYTKSCFASINSSLVPTRWNNTAQRHRGNVHIG